jgi:hypothetical protein
MQNEAPRPAEYQRAGVKCEIESRWGALSYAFSTPAAQATDNFNWPRRGRPIPNDCSSISYPEVASGSTFFSATFRSSRPAFKRFATLAVLYTGLAITTTICCMLPDIEVPIMTPCTAFSACGAGSVFAKAAAALVTQDGSRSPCAGWGHNLP